MEMSTGVSLLRTVQSLLTGQTIPNVICVAEVELYQRGEPIYQTTSLYLSRSRKIERGSLKFQIPAPVHPLWNTSFSLTVWHACDPLWESAPKSIGHCLMYYRNDPIYMITIISTAVLNLCTDAHAHPGLHWSYSICPKGYFVVYG